MKRYIILTCAAMLLPVHHAHAEVPCSPTKLSWNSMPMFIGQTYDPVNKSEAVTYYARIESACVNAAGYIEVWIEPKPYYQESFADKQSIDFRALCNATGDDSCVMNPPSGPHWIERLDTPLYPH